MDLQSKIAARRQQLATESNAAREAAARISAAQEEHHRQKLDADLAKIADEITQDGYPVEVRKQRIEAITAPPPALDFDGLRTKQIGDLLRREARKLWTPQENWTFFILLGVGIYFVPLYGLGCLVLIAAWVNHSNFQTKYKHLLRQSHPAVFGIVQEAP